MFSVAGRRMHANPQLWQRSQLVPELTVDRREAPRCEVRLKIVIRFSSSLSAEAVKSATEAGEIIGESINLSETGLAVCVPSNRIGNRFLIIAGCKLYITLTLPTGPVQMHATPRWCDRLATAERSGCYLIGLRVTEMDDEQWVRLVRYVHDCLK